MVEGDMMNTRQPIKTIRRMTVFSLSFAEEAVQPVQDRLLLLSLSLEQIFGYDCFIMNTGNRFDYDDGKFTVICPVQNAEAVKEFLTTAQPHLKRICAIHDEIEKDFHFFN